jgi:hypothetical protein
VSEVVQRSPGANRNIARSPKDLLSVARPGVPPHVADKILNHQSGTISGVAAVYQKHEFLTERREAFDRWSQHVANLIASAQNQTAGIKPQHELIQLGLEQTSAGSHKWSSVNNLRQCPPDANNEMMSPGPTLLRPSQRLTRVRCAERLTFRRPDRGKGHGR